jgi:ketosteroid isomerase-like protein
MRDDARAGQPEIERAGLIERITAALESGDLTAIGDLLDPEVHWGAPDDAAPGCVNRRQVLAWYRRAREAGAGARVTEVVARPDHILVGIAVRGTPAAAENGGEVARWQVLSVAGGLVTDIRGFDDREQAAARAGISS